MAPSVEMYIAAFCRENYAQIWNIKSILVRKYFLDINMLYFTYMKNKYTTIYKNNSLIIRFFLSLKWRMKVN